MTRLMERMLAQMVDFNEEDGMVTMLSPVNPRTGERSSVTFPGSESTAEATREVLRDTILAFIAPEGQDPDRTLNRMMGAGAIHYPD